MLSTFSQKYLFILFFGKSGDIGSTCLVTYCQGSIVFLKLENAQVPLEEILSSNNSLFAFFRFIEDGGKAVSFLESSDGSASENKALVTVMIEARSSEGDGRESQALVIQH